MVPGNPAPICTWSADDPEGEKEDLNILYDSSEFRPTVGEGNLVEMTTKARLKHDVEGILMEGDIVPYFVLADYGKLAPVEERLVSEDNWDLYWTVWQIHAVRQAAQFSFDQEYPGFVVYWEGEYSALYSCDRFPEFNRDEMESALAPFFTTD